MERLGITSLSVCVCAQFCLLHITISRRSIICLTFILIYNSIYNFFFNFQIVKQYLKYYCLFNFKEIVWYKILLKIEVRYEMKFKSSFFWLRSLKVHE